MKYCWITLLLFLAAFTDVQPAVQPAVNAQITTSEISVTDTTAAAYETSVSPASSVNESNQTSNNTSNQTSNNSLDEATNNTSGSSQTTPISAETKDSNGSNTATHSTTSPGTDTTSSTAEISTSSSTTSVTQKDSSNTKSYANISDSSTTVSSASTLVTSKSTAEAATVAYSSPATTTTGILLPGVRISETNFLLTDSDNDSYFVEMEIHTNVNNVWLVVHDANKTTKVEPLLKHNCIINKPSNGIYTYIINKEQEAWNASRELESVLIALYADKGSADKLSINGLYDFLLFSSYGNINSGLSEEFSSEEFLNQNPIIDHKQLKDLHGISLSRCSEDEEANTAAALTYQSPNETNRCNLTQNQSLQMKLTKPDKKCSTYLNHNFNKTLAKSVISYVNNQEHCGFAFYMLNDMRITQLCSNVVKEINVEFNVRSAFQYQLSLILHGYQNLVVTKSTLNVDEPYDLTNCYQNCFNEVPAPTKSDDYSIRVTIAVVVSCIAIFLVVILFVFLYLRKKKKIILQFSMTRLDEDDDLIGDMDDFVGNQGPTFRSFK